MFLINFVFIMQVNWTVFFSDSIGLSDELSLVYRLLNVWQFATVSSADAHKLLSLGLSCMNAAFSMVICSYGGISSTGSGPSSSTHGGSSTGSSTALQAAVSPGIPSMATSGSVSVSPSQSDVDYQAALMIVAEAIWVQKRIIKILIDDPSSPQTVSNAFKS